MDLECESLRTKWLEVVDDDGAARICMGTDSDRNVKLGINDRAGNPRAIINVNEQGAAMQLRDANNVAGLHVAFQDGFRGFCVLDDSGVERITVCLIKGDPEITLLDPDGHFRLTLALKDQQAEISVNGVHGWTFLFPVPPEAPPP